MPITEENAALSDACALIARQTLSHLRQQPEVAPAANAAVANYPYTGKAVISILLVGVGKVQLTATFDTGDKLEFDAWIYGPIAGAGGISFGGGAFDLSPADLLSGPMGCSVILIPAGVNVLFFRDGLVGSFFGAGPNIGTGSAGGTGTWTRV